MTPLVVIMTALRSSHARQTAGQGKTATTQTFVDLGKMDALTQEQLAPISTSVLQWAPILLEDHMTQVTTTTSLRGLIAGSQIGAHIMAAVSPQSLRHHLLTLMNLWR